MDKTIVGMAIAGTLFFLIAYAIVWALEKKKKQKPA